MPIYEYRCRNGHQFELLQKVSEGPPDACQTCEAPVERVFHPVAVHFKGSGFYNTDYGKKKGKGDKGADSKSGETPAKSSGDSSGKDKSSTSTSSSSSKSD